MLASVVSANVSIAGEMRSLSLKYSRANYIRIKKWCRKFNLDTSHFTGKLTNSGPSHKGPKKLYWSEIFVLDRRNGTREKILSLRRALKESGLKEVCEVCNLLPEWQGKPLTLHIDHRNGNPLDNRPGNPRFLCPNCHTQSETYGAKNIKSPTNPYKVWISETNSAQQSEERHGPILSEVNCANCQLKISKSPRLVKRSKNTFCSSSCKKKYYIDLQKS